MFRIVSVWLCCVLGLSGCIAEPQEGSDLPPLASASPSVSPSPTKSAAPVDDKTAIVALARAYYVEANLAIRTGSTARLRALSIPKCPCRAFADRIAADWRKGKVESPTYYTVVDVRTPLIEKPDTGVVTVFYRTNRYLVLAPSGKVLADVAADPVTQSSRVEMHRINDAWKVFNVVLL